MNFKSLANIFKKRKKKSFILTETQLGVSSLAEIYWHALPPHEKQRLLDVFLIVTGRNFEGYELNEAIVCLNDEQLYKVQKIIERQCNIVKH